MTGQPALLVSLSLPCQSWDSKHILAPPVLLYIDSGDQSQVSGLLCGFLPWLGPHTYTGKGFIRALPVLPPGHTLTVRSSSAIRQ